MNKMKKKKNKENSSTKAVWFDFDLFLFDIVIIMGADAIKTNEIDQHEIGSSR